MPSIEMAFAICFLLMIILEVFTLYVVASCVKDYTDKEQKREILKFLLTLDSSWFWRVNVRIILLFNR